VNERISNQKIMINCVLQGQTDNGFVSIQLQTNRSDVEQVEHFATIFPRVQVAVFG
jgi:hypothetical protein